MRAADFVQKQLNYLNGDANIIAGEEKKKENPPKNLNSSLPNTNENGFRSNRNSKCAAGEEKKKENPQKNLESSLPNTNQIEIRNVLPV